MDGCGRREQLQSGNSPHLQKQTHVAQSSRLLVNLIGLLEIQEEQAQTFKHSILFVMRILSKNKCDRSTETH